MSECNCHFGSMVDKLELYQTIFSMMRDPEEQDEIVAFTHVQREIESLEQRIEIEECYCE